MHWMITCSIMGTLSSRMNPNSLSKNKAIIKIFLVLSLMEMIILKLRPNCFSGISSRMNPSPLSKNKAIIEIFLVLSLAEMIILKLRPNCFSGIYKTYIYVQGEIYSHMVHKDNHVIKSVTQGKKGNEQSNST